MTKPIKFPLNKNLLKKETCYWVMVEKIDGYVDTAHEPKHTTLKSARARKNQIDPSLSPIIVKEIRTRRVIK